MTTYRPMPGEEPKAYTPGGGQRMRKPKPKPEEGPAMQMWHDRQRDGSVETKPVGPQSRWAALLSRRRY